MVAEFSAVHRVLVALTLLIAPVAARPLPLEVAARERSISWLSFPVVSPKSHKAAFVVHSNGETDGALPSGLQVRGSWAPSHTRGDRLYVADSQGTSRDITPMAGAALRPSWSPDGQRLAFYQETASSVHLWVWSPAEGARRVSALPMHPQRWPGDEPVWTDNRHLLVGSARPQDTRWLHTMSQPDNSARTLDTRGRPSLLWEQANIVAPVEIDTATGQARPVPGPPGFFPNVLRASPDGKWLAYVSTGRRNSQGAWVCDLATGRRNGKGGWAVARELAINTTNLDNPVQWHPTRPRLFVHAGRELLEVNPQSGATVRLAPASGPLDYGFQVNPNGESLATLQADSAFQPTWSSPSRAPRRVLRIPLNGAEPEFYTPRGLATELVPDASGALRVLSRDGDQMLLSQCSAGGVVEEQLRFVGRLRPLAAFGDRLLTVAESPAQPPELGQLDQTGFHPLSRISAAAGDVDAGQHRRFTVEAKLNGTPLQLRCSARLPRGAGPAPALVCVYPGSFLADEALTHHGATAWPTALFTSRGYAVLACDAPITREGQPSDPLTDLAQVVEPQVREAARLGWIDPDRVVVTGLSHGGYATAALLVGSSVFRSGIAITGLYDLPAMFSNMQGSESAFLQGQLRMGVSPWADPERYRRNSPYHQADRIHAPLLLLAGEQDRACPATESEKLWNALRFHKADAECAIYPGEEHVATFWSAAHQVDACRRILNFLDRTLAKR